MPTAIIVDAACDLPVDYIRQNNIHVIPVEITVSGLTFFDCRDPETTRNFYKDYSHERVKEARSESPAVSLIRSFLQEKIAKQYQKALIMCLMSNYSATYERAMDAGKELVDLVQDPKEEGKYRLETIRIMDTRTLYAGQAVLAYEAFQLCKAVKECEMQSLYEVLKVLSTNVRVYTVPKDLYYLRNRIRQRHKSVIGILPYTIGKFSKRRPILAMHQEKIKRAAWAKDFNDGVTKIFDLAKQHIANGLLINVIMISYAGNTREIMELSAFRELHTYATEKNVKVHLSIMSITAGINVGPGAISISCCA